MTHSLASAQNVARHCSSRSCHVVERCCRFRTTIKDVKTSNSATVLTLTSGRRSGFSRGGGFDHGLNKEIVLGWFRCAHKKGHRYDTGAARGRIRNFGEKGDRGKGVEGIDVEMGREEDALPAQVALCK